MVISAETQNVTTKGPVKAVLRNQLTSWSINQMSSYFPFPPCVSPSQT